VPKSEAKVKLKRTFIPDSYILWVEKSKLNNKVLDFDPLKVLSSL